jgi:hypothetical protein
MIAPINDAALQAGDVSAIQLCHVAFGSGASLRACASQPLTRASPHVAHGSCVTSKASDLVGRPSVRSFLLLTSAFGRGLRLSHFFRHLCFQCVKIEARASLHRRLIEEGLDFLRHQLLDENEAPELILDRELMEPSDEALRQCQPCPRRSA